jgi:hypothetical protein
MELPRIMAFYQYWAAAGGIRVRGQSSPSLKVPQRFKQHVHVAMAHQFEAEMIPWLGSAAVPGLITGSSDPKGLV